MSTIASPQTATDSVAANGFPEGVSSRREPDAPRSTAWASTPLRQRLRVVAGLRHVLADQSERFVAPLRELPMRQNDAESISAEVLPMAEACAWLGKNGSRFLRPQRFGLRGRPWWLWGVSSEVWREPWGNVLILGPGNFPLFLPGVQVVQALAAGNRVWVKPSPAPGSLQVMRELAAALESLGLPAGTLTVLGTDPAEAEALFPTFDKVVLTGSEATGQAVRARCAEHGIPCTMELSGCDAVYLLDGADLGLAARCVAFALMLNGSATCIAPRRVLVPTHLHDRFVFTLLEQLAEVKPTPLSDQVTVQVRTLVKQAIDDGAHLRCGELAAVASGRPMVLTHLQKDTPLLHADVFAPVLSVLSVRDTDHGLRVGRACGYRLGASVFGPERAARQLAAQLEVGCVVINDCVVPTADPRLPFAGRGRSGYGATRGAAGLLEMTQVKAIASRRRRVHPHLRPADRFTPGILGALLTALHGRGFSRRVVAAVGLIKLYRQQSATPAPTPAPAPGNKNSGNAARDSTDPGGVPPQHSADFDQD